MKALDKNIEYLILTKKEIEDMLKFCRKNKDNVCLVWDKTSIGIVYGVCAQHNLQEENITNINFTDITDMEGW